MEPSPAALDANARAALQKLADVVAPPPVSWLPQTWGWAAVAVLVVAVAVWLTIRWLRRRAANRYRREALRELMRIEAAVGDAATRPQALRAVPELLKRVALTAWPRAQVASLSGSAWVAFLRQSAADACPDGAARLLDDAEYRGPQALDALTAEQARVCIGAARTWIETHRVSA